MNLKIDYLFKDFPEISHQYLDSTKIFEEIGWEARTSITDGLEKSIENYKEMK